jgi:hypothetical protein
MNMDDDQKTKSNDDENTETKYAEGLYGDEVSEESLPLNPETAEINEGLGDDAYSTYDIDDSTLPAENDDDETETGMNEVDADDLSPEMDQMGDVVMDADDDTV